MQDDNSHLVSKAKYFGTAAFFSILMWGWCSLENFSDYRIVKSNSAGREEAIPFSIAVAVTVISFLGALFYWKRALSISKNGIMIEAEVTAVGGEYNGMHNVSFKYKVDGKTYKKRKSLNPPDFQGGVVQIMVDRSKPKRFFIIK